MRQREEHKFQERAGGGNSRHGGDDENGDDGEEKHDRIRPRSTTTFENRGGNLTAALYIGGHRALGSFLSDKQIHFRAVLAGGGTVLRFISRWEESWSRREPELASCSCACSVDGRQIVCKRRIKTKKQAKSKVVRKPEKVRNRYMTSGVTYYRPNSYT